ncbi:hypothetical protein ACE6H2_000919 [Prunus campanulata]
MGATSLGCLAIAEADLAYVLRHFTRAFKYRGLGNEFLEVRDLGNLIGLYTEWHSRLLPYYSFDQFVHEMRSNRLPPVDKKLRERVASGGDPTKLHEPAVEQGSPNDQQGIMLCH